MMKTLLIIAVAFLLVDWVILVLQQKLIRAQEKLQAEAERTRWLQEERYGTLQTLNAELRLQNEILKATCAALAERMPRDGRIEGDEWKDAG